MKRHPVKRHPRSRIVRRDRRRAIVLDNVQHLLWRNVIDGTGTDLCFLHMGRAGIKNHRGYAMESYASRGIRRPEVLVRSAQWRDILAAED